MENSASRCLSYSLINIEQGDRVDCRSVALVLSSIVESSQDAKYVFVMSNICLLLGKPKLQVYGIKLCGTDNPYTTAAHFQYSDSCLLLYISLYLKHYCISLTKFFASHNWKVEGETWTLSSRIHIFLKKVCSHLLLFDFEI